MGEEAVLEHGQVTIAIILLRENQRHREVKWHVQRYLTPELLRITLPLGVEFCGRETLVNI